VGVNDDTCYNCGRRNPGLWGYAPVLRALGNDFGLTPLVIGICVLLYLAPLLLSANPFAIRGFFGFGAPDLFESVRFGASGWRPVIGFDRWWSVLSAGWLHGSLLHIVFNMLAVRQLMPSVIDLYGPGRTMMIYVGGSAIGFLVSTFAGYSGLPLAGGQFTLGASAGICALVGAIWHYGRRAGNEMARSYATQSIIYMIAIGLMVSFIDNYAHAGGVAGGFLLSMLLDPLKRERVDHLMLGLLCLGLSLGAVVLSLLTPLPVS
jgi:rhomboid protease GluP